MKIPLKEFATALFSLIILFSVAFVFNKEPEVKGEPSARNEFVVTAETPLTDDIQEWNTSSPDENMLLNLKNIKQSDGTIDQVFSIINVKSGDNNEVLNVSSALHKELLIPFNTFSPTNKYIFLTEKDENPEYVVLRTDGKDMTGSVKSLEIRKSFNDKYTEYVITDVTGWAGYTVLLVNTDTLDGKTGPSWWFDVTTGRFIRLNGRFN